MGSADKEAVKEMLLATYNISSTVVDDLLSKDCTCTLCQRKIDFCGSLLNRDHGVLHQRNSNELYPLCKDCLSGLKKFNYNPATIERALAYVRQ